MKDHEETKTLDCYIKFLVKKLRITVLDSIILLMQFLKK